MHSNILFSKMILIRKLDGTNYCFKQNSQNFCYFGRRVFLRCIIQSADPNRMQFSKILPFTFMAYIFGASKTM